MSDRPPRDIDPQRFFEEWLPARFSDRFGLGGMTMPDIRVRVDLRGDGGGTWDLEVDARGLRVSPPGPGEPSVHVSQTVEDWRAFTVGEEGAVNLAPPQASPLDVLFIDPTARQMLQAVRGTVRFEVTGYNGRTWALTVKLGDQPVASTPNATITVDAETYSAILARRMAPPDAFFQGKIRLGGDAGLAMQLGMALMPRFG